MTSHVIPTVFALTSKEFQQRFTRLAPISLRLQIDFMDGELVPARSIKLESVPELHAYPVFFEAHLMVAHPEEWIARCAVKGFQKTIIHIEALKNTAAGVLLIQRIKSLGMQPYLAINPETSLTRLTPFIKLIAGVLIMGVHPGKEHQSLAKNTARRITELKKKYPLLKLQVDGGVNDKTIDKLAHAGVNAVNSGSFVSDAKNPKAALHLLEKKFEEGKRKE